MQNKQPTTGFVTSLLQASLPPHYTYHNVAHTLYVVDKVKEIGQQENCTAADMELLETAALWHDTGYLKSYINHEKEGCLLARHYLPVYHYTPEEINKVCGMIMATRIPQSPQNKLEAILADADLEYLGSEEAAVLADKLFYELRHRHPALTKTQWLTTQIGFLQAHRYFTHYCKENKEPVKQAYLDSLLKDLKQV